MAILKAMNSLLMSYFYIKIDTNNRDFNRNGIGGNRTPKGFKPEQLAIVLSYQWKLFQK